MKRIVLIAFILLPFSGWAWGPTGHRVTGWIADKYLNSKAKKQLEKLLDHQSLAIVSTWMDEVRSDSSYDYMADWHWVTVPDGLTYDQAEKNPHGDVIETIERVVKALKSKTLTPAQEAEHIKILIHLVGDIHQPLHVGRGDDKGGNDIKVTWFRNESNLHRVWDSDMIDDTRLSYTELAASLEVPSDEQIKIWQKATVYEWASESMGYRTAVYDIGTGRLSYPYPYKNFHIVRKRLLQAGIRLAGLLNEIYG